MHALICIGSVHFIASMNLTIFYINKQVLYCMLYKNFNKHKWKFYTAVVIYMYVAQKCDNYPRRLCFIKK